MDKVVVFNKFISYWAYLYVFSKQLKIDFPNLYNFYK